MDNSGARYEAALPRLPGPEKRAAPLIPSRALGGTTELTNLAKASLVFPNTSIAPNGPAPPGIDVARVRDRRRVVRGPAGLAHNIATGTRAPRQTYTCNTLPRRQ